MNRTVFILGAGASAEAGAPVMANFVARADELRRRGLPPDEAVSFDLVFRAREKLQRAFIKSSIEINNIEDLYAAFEMAGLIGRLAELKADEVSQLSIAMRRLITRTLEEYIKFRVAPGGEILPPATYEAFAIFLRHLTSELHWPVTIITFNYDLALDYALAWKGLEVDYGLHASNPNGIEVLKLHGSLNWFRSAGDTVVAKLASRSTIMPEAYQPKVSVPLAGLVAESQVLPDTHDPVIVPPTWNKGQYHSEFSSLWRRAGERLAAAENIIVIGYSAPVTDQFYRHLYAVSTISDTILYRYLCIGPNVGQAHQKLIGAAGQAQNIFRFVNEPFSRCYPWLFQELGVDTVDRSPGAADALPTRLASIAMEQPARRR